MRRPRSNAGEAWTTLTALCDEEATIRHKLGLSGGVGEIELANWCGLSVEGSRMTS